MEHQHSTRAKSRGAADVFFEHDESEPMPLGDRREHRRLIRFDPTFTTGSIATMVTMIAGFVGAYGTYQSDRATLRLEIEQIKGNAIGEKHVAKEAIIDLRARVDKVQETLTSVDKAVTGIQVELNTRRKDAK